ncbi:phosphotransferase [Actinoplanes siamensis]|uniref:phosphotransferase n=1 Tax=Actinoplanes siamensis TaxID=1223317 RepID=UPI0019409E5B|nr:phosphotransferase [Actinoplanes siamensis]
MLTFLESIGFAHAPRYLGVDERDRDILTFIPGCTTDHPSQRGHGAYGMGGRILRELHDATDGHALAGTQECVIHGDPGPFNTIFRQGQPVALIDWDSCRPGRRLEDLAYMSWTWCIQSAGNVPIEHQAEHLRELRDGYGSVETELLIDMMLLRQAEIAASEAANARNLALDRVRRQSAEEAVAWAENDSALVRGNRTTLLAALLR